MLACARIGAVHSVVFGGFAPRELAVRIDDAKPKVLVTATCGLEGTKGAIPYMPLVEQALDYATHEVPSIIIKHRSEEAARSAGPVPLLRGRDYDFDALINVSEAAPCVEMAASEPLYTIYTSGTTGDPKGILRDNAHSVMPVDHGELFWNKARGNVLCSVRYGMGCRTLLHCLRPAFARLHQRNV